MHSLLQLLIYATWGLIPSFYCVTYFRKSLPFFGYRWRPVCTGNSKIFPSLSTSCNLCACRRHIFTTGSSWYFFTTKLFRNHCFFFIEKMPERRPFRHYHTIHQTRVCKIRHPRHFLCYNLSIFIEICNTPLQSYLITGFC